jgi:hypothetical protein
VTQSGGEIVGEDWSVHLVQSGNETIMFPPENCALKETRVGKTSMSWQQSENSEVSPKSEVAVAVMKL